MKLKGEIIQLNNLRTTDLKARLASLTTAMRASSQKFRKDKKRCGEMLVELKKRLPHGAFMKFLEKLGLPQSTAWRYMQLAGATDNAHDLKMSVHGHPKDELISLLQKAIRRGDETLAMRAAAELDLSGDGERVWNRLRIIVSEDVGLAAVGIGAEVERVYGDWRRTCKEKGPRPAHRLFTTYAVMLLSRVPKSRLVDNAVNTFYRNYEPIKIPEEDAAEGNPISAGDIPDYAKDMHTASGRKMGRRRNTAEGMNHFRTEGARLENHLVLDRDAEYEAAAFAMKEKKAVAA
jgi:replication-associated recombination protein RarA